MGYRRLDINLLPPEMQPGPVVRYAVVINTILIGLTVAFLIVDSFLGVTKMASLKRDLDTKQEQIRSKASIVSDYNELTKIQDHVDSIGRLINLASADYIDIPVIMDRITRLLPDGVYLDSVTTERTSVGAIDATLRMTLATSRPDTSLMTATFDTLKADDIVGDCYMPSAEFKEVEIAKVIEAAGVSWTASGPDLPDFTTAKQYTFTIQATLHPPVVPGNIPTSLDNSEYYKVPKPESEAESAKPAEGGKRPSGAPEGVSAVEVN